MQIAIQIQLQQIARIVAGTACLGCLGTLEAQPAHRQTLDERIDHTANMIRRNQIVQNHRKQRPLTPTFALHITHKD